MNIFAKLEKKTPLAPRRVFNAWKAIAVVPGENCCQWARVCNGKRFLIPEVPRLPLQGCDSRHCQCKYRHFEDRRATPRRSTERGGFPKHVDTDRRAAACRRTEVD
jgi:hypothetical protein